MRRYASGDQCERIKGYWRSAKLLSASSLKSYLDGRRWSALAKIMGLTRPGRKESTDCPTHRPGRYWVDHGALRAARHPDLTGHRSSGWHCADGPRTMVLSMPRAALSAPVAVMDVRPRRQAAHRLKRVHILITWPTLRMIAPEHRRDSGRVTRQNNRLSSAVTQHGTPATANRSPLKNPLCLKA